MDEISEVEEELQRREEGVKSCGELLRRRDRLVNKKVLSLRKVREFRHAMECVLDYLDGKVIEDGNVEVLRLRGHLDWGKIHCLIKRECRRLEDGLPIYAYRQDILRKIKSQQVMILIGETGSGKSTQLLQFLADSGVSGNKSTICTEPRKLAAMSLTERVKDESFGCYQEDSVICCSRFSFDEQFDAKIMYTTDFCLLQHYMNDKCLTGISCIIIDDAHERSVNTDLLLALIKKLLNQKPDLRLIVMSAMVNEKKLTDYFSNCETIHVPGRNFPVDIEYVPCASAVPSTSDFVASYVREVVRVVTEIHRTEKEGAILAFLTSQMEVEWACEHFQATSAVALPLHGKLSHKEQFRIYLAYPRKRKVIFSTNLAETCLTIPGVKYVVDSGMVKENRYEPETGMNVLRVSWISQSSANQRAGRAGRTEPGKCYRLYGERDFRCMTIHPKPEICRVHLGISVLRILSFGVKSLKDFDFVEAPDPTAIEKAMKNLIYLGAVTQKNDVHELTKEGRDLIKLGMEPRLGKIILKCFNQGLAREGLVLAAVIANSSTIFHRVGTEEEKRKSDRRKVQFCHSDGDLFTLLSVYKQWECTPLEKKNKWCWDNSVNAKSMWRCEETVQELEFCLQREFNFIIPNYWRWDPEKRTEHDGVLKSILLSSLSENVAMYSGYDQLGYEVALTGKHVQLHPSSALLLFGQRPTWVVFGEIVAISDEYLVCVNAIDVESLNTLSPPLVDISQMVCRKLLMEVLTGFGHALLRKFCGKSNSNLVHLLSKIRADWGKQIGIEVNVDHREVVLFAPTKCIGQVTRVVLDALGREEKWLRNECLEKCLYNGGSVALFGAGAEIKHLELEQRYLAVDVYHSDADTVNDKDLFAFFEMKASGSICSVHKSSWYGQNPGKMEKRLRVTFLTPDAAERAAGLGQIEAMGASVEILPSRDLTYAGDNNLSFPAIRGNFFWPRRPSKGFGFVKCDRKDVDLLINDFSDLVIGEQQVHCEASMYNNGTVILRGLDKEVSEAEICNILRSMTGVRILNFSLARGGTVENPPSDECELALMREITPFVPKGSSVSESVRVQVFSPKEHDIFMKASITFDGSLHLEAAKALEQIEGKVLPGCRKWQKIKCKQLFHSSVSCPAPVYPIIKEQLDKLLSSLRHRIGAEFNLYRNKNGSYRVKISASATKTVADLRRLLEQLMNGKIINHVDLTLPVLQLLFTRNGIALMKSIQQDIGTYILFDRHTLSLRIFGRLNKIKVAEQKLVQSLVAMNDSKQLEVHLRGGSLPPDLMKKVVEKFGPDLNGLKEIFPESEFTLNTRHHIIYIQGSKELKQKVQDMLHEIAEASGTPLESTKGERACPICLCDVDDSYCLESCSHEFCRLCLVEQCESAIRSRDNFPLRCTHKDCGAMILMMDLRSLLSSEKLEELFRASLSAFVAQSEGKFRFCPSPDCPSVYEVKEYDQAPFVCGACFVETCVSCHQEYHPNFSCDMYRKLKEDPDSSLREWCKGKDNVKLCPVCGHVIEKDYGCDHVECRCASHICWVCLEFFSSSDQCYSHLRSMHHLM